MLVIFQIVQVTAVLYDIFYSGIEVQKAVVCLILGAFSNKFNLCVLVVNEVQEFVLRVVPTIKLKISIFHELSEVSLHTITPSITSCMPL